MWLDESADVDIKYTKETHMIGKLLRKILTPSPKGLIELYGLQDWYQSLAAETRVKIKTYYTLGTQGNSDEVDIVHPNTLVIKHRGSQRFLGVIGLAAMKDDPLFAELILLKALNETDGSVSSTHMVLEGLSSLLYQQQSTRIDASELCIKYCLQDIECIESSKDIYIEAHGLDNFILFSGETSFDRLRKIYVQQRKYSEAIAIVNRALTVAALDADQATVLVQELSKKRVSEHRRKQRNASWGTEFSRPLK